MTLIPSLSNGGLYCCPQLLPCVTGLWGRAGQVPAGVFEKVSASEVTLWIIPVSIAQIKPSEQPDLGVVAGALAERQYGYRQGRDKV